MYWATLPDPLVCPRCQVEHPAGAQMAAFTVGTLILYRCAPCENAVSSAAAAIERKRLAGIKTSEEEAAIAAKASFGTPLSVLAAQHQPVRRRPNRA